MKELDKSQVYSLEGITYRQAEDLAAVLSAIHKEWRPRAARIANIMNSEYLIYTRHMWCHGSGDQTPTASILDLFDKEQTLEDLIRQRDELNRRIEKWSMPNDGDVCVFWNDAPGVFVIAKHFGYRDTNDRDKYIHAVQESPDSRAVRITWYKNARKVTPEEVIDLLFTKKGDV